MNDDSLATYCLVVKRTISFSD